MPYLAIHTDVDQLQLGTGWTTYRAHDIRLPAPRYRTDAEMALRWGAEVTGRSHELAERYIPLDIMADDEEAAETALIALQNAVSQHRARIVWQSASDRPMIYTTIRVAHLSEPRHSQLRADGKISVVLECLTDSCWTDTEGIDHAPLGFTLPHVMELVSTKGDLPARARIKFTTSSANTLLGLGIELDPADDYDAIDTYTPSAETLTSDYASIITPATFDANANRGPCVLVTEFATNAVAPSNTRVRAVGTVTGSGVSDVSEAEFDSIAAAAAGPVWLALPSTVYMPPGGTPGVDMSSGYGSEGDRIDSSTGVTQSPILDGFYQTFETATLFRHTSCILKFKESGVVPRQVKVELRNVSGGSPGSTVYASATETVSATFDGEVTFTYDSPYVLPAGTYAICATLEDATDNTTLFVYCDTYAGYADGAGGIIDGGYFAGAWMPYAELVSHRSGASLTPTINWYPDPELAHTEGQTFTLTEKSRIDSVIIKSDGTGSAKIQLEVWSGGTPGAGSELVRGVAETQAAAEAEASFALTGMDAGQYWLHMNAAGPAPAGKIYYNPSGTYDGGDRYICDAGSWTVKTGEDLFFAVSGYEIDKTVDFYFKIRGELPLGFDATIDIEAKCSESSKTGTVSEVVRVPASHFAVVIPASYDVSDGFLIDAVDPLVPPAAYSTTSTTGTAGPALSPSVWHGIPAIWPGTNRLVLFGNGTSKIQITYYPCYSHAAAGEL